MTDGDAGMIRQPLRSPRSAGIAGVIFALLLGAAMVLTQWSMSDAALDDASWLDDRADIMRLAMGILPFAGIAFLWFIGVVRDQMGDLEDKLFATVFLGSGLLFLAMLFTWSGLVWAALATHASDPEWSSSDAYRYASSLMKILAGTFTLRMAGVFVLSASSLWLRTKVMPRWVIVFSIVLALVFLIGGSNLRVLRLAFPVWVLTVSVIILMKAREMGGADAPDPAA
jgi:hypothetical protein